MSDHDLVREVLPGYRLSGSLGSSDAGDLLEVSRWVGGVLEFRTVWIDKARRVVEWDCVVDRLGWVVSPDGVRVELVWAVEGAP